MEHLVVEHFGPIRKADITFGDLTVLVGPQASGKSLFVQLFKAIKDAGAIRTDLASYGYDWSQSKAPVRDFSEAYFGRALRRIVTKQSRIHRDGKRVYFRDLAKPATEGSPPVDTVFVIPAQRASVMPDGWPRGFKDYSADDPYCVRKFSERVRRVMEYFGRYPDELSFDRSLARVSLGNAIFTGGVLTVQSKGPRRRMVLVPEGSKAELPVSVWSAGQREFTPLLLGLSDVPEDRSQLGIGTVVIEEPEMGLHPQAIVSFGVLVLELLDAGYRVVISTHSPVVLDLVWAIRELKDYLKEDPARAARAHGALHDVFDVVPYAPEVTALFETPLRKDYRTYFFERKGDAGVVVRDISTLDPGSDDDVISGWGGLSGYSGHIADIVGKAISEGNA